MLLKRKIQSIPLNKTNVKNTQSNCNLLEKITESRQSCIVQQTSQDTWKYKTQNYVLGWDSYLVIWYNTSLRSSDLLFLSKDMRPILFNYDFSNTYIIVKIGVVNCHCKFFFTIDYCHWPSFNSAKNVTNDNSSWIIYTHLFRYLKDICTHVFYIRFHLISNDKRTIYVDRFSLPMYFSHCTISSRVVHSSRAMNYAYTIFSSQSFLK